MAEMLKMEKKVVEEIKSNGGKADLALGDVTDFSGHKALIEGVIAKGGKLDILVNNAGAFFQGSFEKNTMEEYDKIQTINIRSMISLTHHAFPYLKQTKGNIVNLSSVNAILPLSNAFAYNISKGAVIDFTTNLALEVGPLGIRVNAVSPGFTKTYFASTLPGPFLDLIGTKAHPLGRVGLPDDIGNAIAFFGF